MNVVYDATRVPISRRLEKLSWSHHAELAAFDIHDQKAGSTAAWKSD
jgi:hypothetical protein